MAETGTAQTTSLAAISNPARPEIERMPSLLSPPSGCMFHTRCPHAFERCRHESPALQTLAPGHTVACHLYANGLPGA